MARLLHTLLAFSTLLFAEVSAANVGCDNPLLSIPEFVTPQGLDSSCGGSGGSKSCYLITPSDKKGCKNPIKYIECFISKCNCPKPNRAYHQFDGIVVFLEPIPVDGARHVFGRNTSSLSKKVDDIIDNTCDYANFDALIPFFYTYDVAKGLSPEKNVYDIHYLNWFINRFYYYLSTVYFAQRKPVVTTEITSVNEITGIPTLSDSIRYTGRESPCCPGEGKKDYDLVCLSKEWSSYTYGEEAIVIFNRLVANTIIGPFVTKFINILRRQIREAYDKCISRDSNGARNATFTTYNLYYDLLSNTLDATADLIRRNHDIKDAFLRSKYYATFATIPYSFTTPPPPPGVLPIHTKAFMVISNQSVSLDKVIDYS